MKNLTPKQIADNYKKDLADLTNWYIQAKDSFTKKAIKNVVSRMIVLFNLWDSLSKKDKI